METKHTPGPWNLRMQDDTDIVISGKFQNGKHKGMRVADRIATVSCGLNDVQSANARLIASAPELLQLFERGLECGIFDDAPVYKEDVMRIIAKAEGK